MKSIQCLTENWRLHNVDAPLAYPAGVLSAVDADAFCGSADGYACAMPSVVQEVLFAHGVLPTDVLETGLGADCAWVSDRDWVFTTTFPRPETNGPVYLHFKGLDTIVDVYINGQRVARHESMFMPLTTDDIRPLLQDDNTLLLYFYAPEKVVATYELPDHYAGRITAHDTLRKAHGDFSPHGGAVPYFTPIGVYDDIYLVAVDTAEITYADIETTLDWLNIDGTVRVGVHCTPTDGAAVRVRLLAPDDTLVAEMTSTAFRVVDGEMVADFVIPVKEPQLWWPRNYGAQPLYHVECELVQGEKTFDRVRRTVGIRKIETVGDLRFRVNGVEIKLWGSCITPMWGCSHRWNPERGRTILDYAARGNMNALRLWGPGQQYHEDFYEYACELGILIWQEFHTWNAYVPDLERYHALVMREAEIEIRRLKHYPCILLWCGGNEHLYMADIFHPEDRIRIGYELLMYDLRDLVGKMDRTRHYHVS